MNCHLSVSLPTELWTAQNNSVSACNGPAIVQNNCVSACRLCHSILVVILSDQWFCFFTCDLSRWKLWAAQYNFASACSSSRNSSIILSLHVDSASQYVNFSAKCIVVLVNSNYELRNSFVPACCGCWTIILCLPVVLVPEHNTNWWKTHKLPATYSW